MEWLEVPLVHCPNESTICIDHSTIASCISVSSVDLMSEQSGCRTSSTVYLSDHAPLSFCAALISASCEESKEKNLQQAAV